MFYVLLTADGDVDRYPYTLTDLKFDHPGTSFPASFSDELAASYNVFPVVPADQPAFDYRYDLERKAVKKDGRWVEVWTQVAAPAEEVTQRTADQALAVRTERDQRLKDSDWSQLPDAQCDHAKWAAYRQQLRDIPAQEGFPWKVVWPTV